jgi:hypothetical protein
MLKGIAIAAQNPQFNAQFSGASLAGEVFRSQMFYPVELRAQREE